MSTWSFVCSHFLERALILDVCFEIDSCNWWNHWQKVKRMRLRHCGCWVNLSEGWCMAGQMQPGCGGGKYRGGCRLGWGKLAGELQRRGEREERGREKRHKHASYVMIIIKHRGRLFSTLPRLGGTGLGPRAGVQGGEKHRKRGRRGRETAREKTEGVIGRKKRQIGERQRWVLIKRLKGRHKVLMTLWLWAIVRQMRTEVKIGGGGMACGLAGSHPGH